MWTAWKQGRSLLADLGKRAAYGAMKEKTDGNASQAERLRTYRAMAQRISESELSTICGLCELHGKAWGPTFLVALSRLGTARERREMSKLAIREGWGLAEVQRRIKRNLGPQKDATRVGRKRHVNIMDKADILDQINSLCVGWIRFAAQLEQDDVEVGEKAGLELLPAKLRKQVAEVTKRIAALQKLAEKGVARVQG